MQSGRSRLSLIFLNVLLIGAGIAAGYYYFSHRDSHSVSDETIGNGKPLPGDDQFVSVYYPSGGRLIIEERRIDRKLNMNSLAEAVAAEYFRGPTNREKTVIPAGVKILGLYSGSDRILYLNLSDEFRRNFQGGAAAEYLLLKGLHESIMSNVSDVGDIKIIIEGKEIESLGGHIYLFYPLKHSLNIGEADNE